MNKSGPEIVNYLKENPTDISGCDFDKLSTKDWKDLLQYNLRFLYKCPWSSIRKQHLHLYKERKEHVKDQKVNARSMG